jgi:hypothetical protein
VSVFTGIFMLIILLGAGRGLRNGFEHGFKGNAINAIHIWGGTTSMPYKRTAANRDVQLTTRTWKPCAWHGRNGQEFWQSTDCGVAESLLNFKEKYGNYSINGIEPEFLHLEDQTIVAGRFINELDMEEGRKVIVLATDSRDKLFDKADPLHQWMQVNGIPFEVVGVYKFESGRGQNDRSQVFLPLSTAQRVFGGERKLDQISFHLHTTTLEGSLRAANGRAASWPTATSSTPRMNVRSGWRTAWRTTSPLAVCSPDQHLHLDHGHRHHHRWHHGRKQHHAHRGEGPHQGDRRPQSLGATPAQCHLPSDDRSRWW